MKIVTAAVVLVTVAAVLSMNTVYAGILSDWFEVRADEATAAGKYQNLAQYFI